MKGRIKDDRQEGEMENARLCYLRVHVSAPF